MLILSHPPLFKQHGHHSVVEICRHLVYKLNDDKSTKMPYDSLQLFKNTATCNNDGILM